MTALVLVTGASGPIGIQDREAVDRAAAEVRGIVHLAADSSVVAGELDSGGRSSANVCSPSGIPNDAGRTRPGLVDLRQQP